MTKKKKNKKKNKKKRRKKKKRKKKTKEKEKKEKEKKIVKHRGINKDRKAGGQQVTRHCSRTRKTLERGQCSHGKSILAIGGKTTI